MKHQSNKYIADQEYWIHMGYTSTYNEVYLANTKKTYKLIADTDYGYYVSKILQQYNTENISFTPTFNEYAVCQLILNELKKKKIKHHSIKMINPIYETNTIIDLHNRKIIAIPLNKEDTQECDDCHYPAKYQIFEWDDTKGWYFCGTCDIGG